MVLTTRSQVEKFNARMSKMEMDTRELGEAKFIDNKANSDSGVDSSKLNEAGGIKEAAMVISYDGMEAFATMFSNSIEVALSNVITNRMDDIAKSVESRLEKVFEAKMIEAMGGLSEGMLKFSKGLEGRTEAILNSSVDSFINSLQTHYTDPVPTKASVEDLKEEEQTEVHDDTLRISDDNSEAKVFLSEIDEETRNKLVAKKIQEEKEMQEFIAKQKGAVEEVEYRTIGSKKEEIFEVSGVITAFLKSSAEPMKMSVIFQHLKEVSGIVPRNGTVVMDSLIKGNYNIEKKGFGLYGYEEKTFKPIN